MAVDEHAVLGVEDFVEVALIEDETALPRLA